MKKPKKSTVHPSPSPPPPHTTISHHLALLPATIFTLTVTLSPEDQEILAYLLSKKTVTNSDHSHSPLFNCSCFRCYISYWVRWDSSPNRHLIHQIIDAFEDPLIQNNHHKSKKDRRKKLHTPISASNTRNNAYTDSNEDEIEQDTAAVELTRSPELSQTHLNNEFESVVDCEKEQGTVRRMMSFVGERIWSVWT